MILSNIKGITIPEGAVKQIADGAGRVLWKAAPSSIVPGLVIGYSGDYTDQTDVVMGDGKTYRLLTLTGSGTLTLDQSVKADVWLCAGGNGGRSGGAGGGGGKFIQSNGLQLDVSTVCTIGAGSKSATSNTNGIGGTTTFGSLQAVQETGTYAAAKGASGGGGGGVAGNAYKQGAGGGVTTVPFGGTGTFDEHSAGGGGGGYQSYEDDVYYSGGAGGRNGADGGERKSGGYDGGAGGYKGGGAGGIAEKTGNAGGAATFYGSGGGGGSYTVSGSGTARATAGGAGYQGVIYVRLPYEQ